MGIETVTKTVVRCDNGCGAEEEYDDEFELAVKQGATLPYGWRRDYDNGDSIFGYICGDCVLDFEEGGGH